MKIMDKKKKILLAALALTIVLAAAAGVLWYQNSPNQIVVLNLPDKTVYDYGDTLNPQGLILEVTYNSGRKETVTEDFTCAPMALTTAGEQDITVTWGGKTAVFSVEAIPVLAEVRVAAVPAKTRYLPGEALAFEGLTLEASFNDDSTQAITEGFSCAPETAMDKKGSQEITVTYEDKTAVFSVDVVEVTSISVRTKPAQQTYMVGDTIDLTGASLTVTCRDGQEQDIREGFTCGAEPFAEAGEQEVTLAYMGKEATFSVNVLPKITFDNLKATGESVGIRSLGEGYNQNMDSVTWAIVIEHDLPTEIRESFTPEITCSWDRVVNGNGVWEQSCSFDSAKEGITYAEYGTYENIERFMYILYLPDDPSIEGEQSVELKVGNCTKTITFTLSYSGDYVTGTGWRVNNIKF